MLISGIPGLEEVLGPDAPGVSSAAFLMSIAIFSSTFGSSPVTLMVMGNESPPPDTTVAAPLSSFVRLRPGPKFSLIYFMISLLTTVVGLPFLCRPQKILPILFSP
ncbi:MAG: hypothetical protein BWY84_01218 [Candidatus Aerophobetes bacterium ADurb.Bin490]|nr:MAG: hypothetical protein BWY84_01218 [Candidatus Aerophobetes bacterium ADurb.Bin490]